jgi:hypothetical protein
MAQRSMVLFRVARSNQNMLFESKEHVPRGCRERDTEPAFTKLKLTAKKIAGNYYEARITHREGVPIEGYWHGERIHEVVSVSVLAAYYNLARKVFIVEAPYSLASAAIRRLNKDCGKDIRLTPVRIDFNALLRAKEDVVVRGAWTSSPKDAIRSRAAFSGSDLKKQTEFKHMCKSGELSSMSVNYPFKKNDLRVSLSRSCAAFFLEPVDLDLRLEFMEHLAEFEAKEKPSRRRTAKSAKSSNHEKED